MLECVFLILLIFYFCGTRQFSYWKERNVPYVNPVPFFGNLLNIFLLKCNIGEQLSELYSSTKGPICGLFMLTRPALMIRDPKLIRQFLVDDADILSNRLIAEGANEEQNSKGAYGLFVGKNETWKNLRKAIAPAFSSMKIKMISTNIEDSNKKLKEYVKLCTIPNNEVEIKDICMRYSIHTLCSVFFDVNADCFSREETPWRLYGSCFFDYGLFNRGVNVAMNFISPRISKIFGLNFYDKKTFDFVVENVNKSLRNRKNKPYTKNDYLEVLKNAAMNLKGQECVLCSSVEIFAAGVESVAAALIFACYELGKNQNVQHRLRVEIRAVLGVNEEASYAVLNNLLYLDLFVKELYRFHPQNPFLERVAKHNFNSANLNFAIEKGMTIYVPTLGIHHDPHYYPEPEKFLPERFLGIINWATYFPFGMGPSMCIGKKYSEIAVKLCIVNLVRNFEIKFSSRTPPNINYNSKGFTLQVLGDLYMELKYLNEEK